MNINNINKIFELLEFTLSIEDEDYEQVFDKSWFDDLPCSIQQKVFHYLDKQSLMKFAQIYPNYKIEVVRPVYWEILNLFVYANRFSNNDAINLVRHFKSNLKRLFLDFDYFERSTVFEIISCVPNLKQLKALNIQNDEYIGLICNYLRNLECLIIDLNGLENKHLIQIADNLIHLKKIKLFCNEDVSDGLVYLFRKASQIAEFEITSWKNIDKEPLKLLLSLHCNSLTKLKFTNAKIDDEIQTYLSNCKRLNNLNIRGNFSNENGTKINYNNLKELASISINGHPKTRFFNLFTKQNFNLRFLNLESFVIDNTEFELLARCCPNLNELKLVNISNLSDVGLENGLRNLENLKVLRISNLNNPFIIYDFLTKVPYFILSKIRLVEIIIDKRFYNSKNKNNIKSNLNKLKIHQNIATHLRKL